jgi:hypothetical protein
MAAVLLAVVDQLDAHGMKRLVQAAKHLGCHRAGSTGIHAAYIEGFYS